MIPDVAHAHNDTTQDTMTIVASGAPTVGLEDKIFTIGTTVDTAKFEVVKEELGKHFATQPWSDGANAVIAIDTLTEPSYHEPKEPEFPLKMMDGVGDQKLEDPEYEVKLI